LLRFVKISFPCGALATDHVIDGCRVSDRVTGMSASGRKQSLEVRREGSSWPGIQKAEFLLPGAWPGIQCHRPRDSDPLDYRHGLAKSLKSMVGPPGLEPGTKGIIVTSLRY